MKSILIFVKDVSMCLKEGEMNRMKKSELKKFKEVLLDLKDRIMKEIDRIESDTLGKSQKDLSGDLSGYTLHMADLGTDAFEREFMLNLATNKQELLYEIDEALQKIEEGTYGICESCNKPIPQKRLKALPFAKFCKKCQQEIEKQQY